jgi:5'(3')-deoxyribonucleotidase
MIAVDIDSTLADFEKSLRQAFIDLAREKDDKEYFRGAYVSWVEWRSPTDIMGEDKYLEAHARVHNPDTILAQPPIEGSVDVLQRVAKYHKIIYISHRASELMEATDIWLSNNNFPSGHLICSGPDKKELLHQCDYLIDDRPKTLVEFVYDPLSFFQRKAFGLLYDHNRSLTDIPNIYLAPSWDGILYYLDRKLVVPEV